MVEHSFGGRALESSLCLFPILSAAFCHRTGTWGAVIPSIFASHEPKPGSRPLTVNKPFSSTMAIPTLRQLVLVLSGWNKTRYIVLILLCTLFLFIIIITPDVTAPLTHFCWQCIGALTRLAPDAFTRAGPKKAVQPAYVINSFNVGSRTLMFIENWQRSFRTFSIKLAWKWWYVVTLSQILSCSALLPSQKVHILDFRCF